MKKLLFLTFAFCAMSCVAQGQPPRGGQPPRDSQSQPAGPSAFEKEKAKYESKMAKSNAEIVDAKKSLDPKTWISRAELYTEMYELPVKNIMLGMLQLQVKTAMKSERSQTDNAELQGSTYDVLKYPFVTLYFDKIGILTFWDITAPVTDDPLFVAREAYIKAYELDAKKSQTKKITQGLSAVANKMVIEAQGAYNLNKLEDALKYFEGSLKCTGHQAVNTTDTLIIYNTGLIARMAGNHDKALEYFKKAIDIGYEQEGSTIANYASMIREKGDTIQAMEILRNGFIKYPKNQEILVALINGYLSSGQNLSEVLPFIKQGQENEPTNASLFYAEGVVYQNLEELDKAMSCFQKSIELNPDFYAAQYSIGALYYNKAVEIQNQASMELDDSKYEKMVVEMDAEFEKALPYLRKAHEVQPNERAVVESLRSIYYRYREKNDEMKAQFEHFSRLLEEM